MKSLFRAKILRVTLFCVVGTLVGCEQPPQFGQVSGVVTLAGKPLEEVRVMFLPVPTGGGTGRAQSESLTDKEGRYQLVYSIDGETHGAVLGEHLVVIQDIAAENSRDKYQPIRIDSSYSSASHTPLKEEVVPGEQTFDFELKPSR